MDLKQFIKEALNEIMEAIEEVRTSSNRDVKLTDAKSIEFDIATSVENTDSAKGEAAIKVFGFGKAGGKIGNEFKNSNITRIKFSVNVDDLTKKEKLDAITSYEKAAQAYIKV